MDIMRRQKYGRIINIASLAGKIGGVFIGADYSASKAGVISLTKSFAKHLGKFGITVNAVSPGTVMTSMMDYWPKNMLDKILKSVVMGRFGLPDDIAQAVLFLSSEKASWITGEILDVDGGESAFYQLER
jgi:3-oxoacyl-[acyl-carrier protein] reductase